MAESTNGAVKVEFVNREEYPTRAYAEKQVARYIELFCNSLLGYRTPQEVLDDHRGFAPARRDMRPGWLGSGVGVVGFGDSG